MSEAFASDGSLHDPGVSALLADAMRLLSPTVRARGISPGLAVNSRSSSTPSGDPLDQTIVPEPARVQVRRYG